MAQFHPILNATETTPGTWLMVGPLDEVYATITFIRRGAELGYRVVALDGSMVGYFTNLRAACKAAHTWFTSTRGPHGIPHAGYAGAEWGTPNDRKARPTNR